MLDDKPDKRKFKRYNTEARIYFDFAYDLETKVKFDVIDEKKVKKPVTKYSAVSRNISAEGLCFVSHKDLKKGDFLYLEVFLPSAKEPIHMRGETMWCDLMSDSFDHLSSEDKKKKIYCTGVKVELVDGKDVKKSIHYDQEYKVNWSIVLESVFGSYKMLMGEKYKKRSE